MTRAAGALLALVLVTGAFAAPLPASAANLGILVPAYFYPSANPSLSFWDELNAAVAQAPLIAIMNPASGPGASQNPDYVSAVNALRAAGGGVIGYVSTSYTARSLAAVKADIDSYHAWYAIAGIFLDEMTNDASAAHLDYYAELYAYVKSKSASYAVFGNPGTNTEESYLTRPAADTLVIFESNTGYAAWQPDAWVAGHPRSSFANLPYNVASASTMESYLALAVSRNIGWIYVTDDLGANPWDTLPAYWTAEVNAVAAQNAQSIPALSLVGMAVLAGALGAAAARRLRR